MSDKEDKEQRLTSLLMRFMVFPVIKNTDDEYKLSVVDFQKVRFKEILLKECLISIYQEKNIVSTIVKGRPGTVKEYISNSDYQLTLEIGLSNFDFQGDQNSFEYPIESLTEFIEMLQLAVPIHLMSDFLKVFEINTGVVKSYYLTQETHSNRQSIILNMLSDDNYLIKINE